MFDASLFLHLQGQEVNESLVAKRGFYIRAARNQLVSHYPESIPALSESYLGIQSSCDMI